ncbi:pyridoxal phosphate-dependent aminotransferase [Candidatus Woesearchaeota archaeon]|nr:pyridoxal phosphate-dependent aminotransferase [Candidatus Woesearchaeota archaeon]
MLAKRLSNISESKTLAVTGQVIALRSKGVTVISFGAGEPDFDTPQHIKDAAVDALERSYTKYTENSGILPLKKAICQKLQRENNLTYTPEQIIVSNGGKHSLINVFFALLNKGDEVIIPIPYWTSYPEQVKIAEGTPVFCGTKHLKVTTELIGQKITKKTKILILNSPSNPSGAIIEQEELEKIKELVLKHNLYVISDEVYEHFIYDGKKNKSIACLGQDIKKKTIIVNSVSKTYAMTGWRIGFTAAEKDIIKAMDTLQSQMTSNSCSIAQHASVAAYNGDQSCVEKMRNEFEQRRNLLVEGLRTCKGITCNLPEGAFYAFPSIKNTGLSSEVFSQRLLAEKHVAVVPGIAFGRDDYIRLSYACSVETIKEGVRLLKEFCD